MKTYTGIVVSGFRYATANLAPIMQLIENRSGLANLVHGTLNLQIPEDYVVRPDALILAPHECLETIKLQRCLVHGYKSIIVRPEPHETRIGYGHGKNHFEIMSTVQFRTSFHLHDGDSVEVQIEGDDEWWGSGRSGL